MSKQPSKRHQATAHHEAGHAVVAIELGLELRAATILPDGTADSRGQVENAQLPDWFSPEVVQDDDNRILAEQAAMRFMAGPVAEFIFTGRWNHAGARHDDKITSLLLECFAGDVEECSAWTKYLRRRTFNLLSHLKVRYAVAAVASALLERQTLTGKQIRQVYSEAINLFFRREQHSASLVEAP